MPTDIDTYLHLDYAVQVIPKTTSEGKTVYVASHPDLPGCIAHGATPTEAQQNLAEARQLYIRGVLQRGGEIPMPTADRPTIIWQNMGRPTAPRAPLAVWPTVDFAKVG